jgi:hypothetical protein
MWRLNQSAGRNSLGALRKRACKSNGPLSGHSLYDRTTDPRRNNRYTYRFLGEGKNAASLKQIRAALSFAYKHWDLKNPFAKIEPPLHKEPQIRYLLLSDIRRFLDYLRARQQGYGSALAFHLANALFQTACRFDEVRNIPFLEVSRVSARSPRRR